MILIIDNYDSFTYNLVQLIGQQQKEMHVVRNDKISVEEAEALKPDFVVISPGPGRPENAGICVELIRTLGRSIPILGVCLGHQAIGYAFGATITHTPTLMHGKVSQIYHHGDGLFRGLPNPFTATRYHSLVISHENLPDELKTIALTKDDVIMGVRHHEYPIEGIQFHPESILTKDGLKIIENFLSRKR